ncbi:unnamed protein product [Didymodactylos carnosus]|uniref:Uncharacterized protein n=1 Tax=Didymodactylos carnosus TaxID=1234261 RepID=A0A814DYE3_9BILA|nr:unnamed protein product [Didymodactylos carnosus]CAF3734625.1 unnamed protein product [Didymodactylos carnosus]
MFQVTRMSDTLFCCPSNSLWNQDSNLWEIQVNKLKISGAISNHELDMLLFDYFPLNINGEKRSGIQNLFMPITEIIVHVCVWSLFFEELRQMSEHYKESRKLPETRGIGKVIWRYFWYDKWNTIDLTAYGIYVVGFTSRFIVKEPAFILSNEKLGGKLLMILHTLLQLFCYYSCSATIDRVKNNSHEEWCYHRYLLVEEYAGKQTMIPPFNLLLWPCERYASRFCIRAYMSIPDEIIKEYWQRERRIADQLWQEKVAKIMQKSDEDGHTASRLIKYLRNSLLPSILPLLFSLKTIKNVHNLRRRTNPNHHHHPSRIDGQLTTMLVMQWIIIILSSIPYCSQLIYPAITIRVQKDSFHSAVETLVTQIVRLLYYLNFVSSFYIYLVSSPIVRTEAGKVFKKFFNQINNHISP